LSLCIRYSEAIEQQFIGDSASSDQAVDDFAIICEYLSTMASWTEEQKSNLIQLMSEWENNCKSNIQHLSKLFTDPNGLVLNLPADTILKLVQSNDIPADCWLDCLLATLLEENAQI